MTFNDCPCSQGPLLALASMTHISENFAKIKILALFLKNKGSQVGELGKNWLS
jgi:hypothetical protein